MNFHAAVKQLTENGFTETTSTFTRRKATETATYIATIGGYKVDGIWVTVYSTEGHKTIGSAVNKTEEELAESLKQVI